MNIIKSKVRVGIYKIPNMKFRVLFAAVTILFVEEAKLRKKALSFQQSKFLIHVIQLQQCPEPEYANSESKMINIRINKLNRTVRGLNGDFFVNRVWDADVGIEIKLEKWAYAGWTRLPFVYAQPDFCHMMEQILQGYWTEIWKDLGVRDRDACPIQPGVYKMQNLTYNLILTDRIIPLKGRFQARIILRSVKTKQLILCLFIMFTAEEYKP